jgi:hypothetical protein
VVLAAALGVAVANLSCGSAAPAPLSAPWLGLNYNSGSNTGPVNQFSLLGITYDREGALEVSAGQTPQNTASLARGLRRVQRAGMVPDMVINPSGGRSGCTGDPNGSTLCLPTDRAAVRGYVRDAVLTMATVLRFQSGRRVLFEPMNEPWSWASPPGTPSGRLAAAEFAAVLAQLLPRARAAGVPLSDIYVPAAGTLIDGSSWVPDLYAAQPCLGPGSASCGPIAGWNVHAYGPPYSTSAGIGSLPGIRAQMLSGENNIVVSEVGFCAVDVGRGRLCNQNRPDIDGSSTQTATWLAETLRQAVPMRRAGWLKALLVWARSGGGWAMQTQDGSLTQQGRVLALFAASPNGLRLQDSARRGSAAASSSPSRARLVAGGG